MKTYEDKVTFKPNRTSERAVYISRLDRRVLTALADFVSEGIRQGDLCLAVLSRPHIRALHRLLRAMGVDLQAATESEQYLALNAKSIMEMTSNGSGFSETAYQNAIEKISKRAARKGQRVRAFGEVIDLKWPKLGFYVPQNE